VCDCEIDQSLIFFSFLTKCLLIQRLIFTNATLSHICQSYSSQLNQICIRFCEQLRRYIRVPDIKKVCRSLSKSIMAS
jgi:hypothetical protein